MIEVNAEDTVKVGMIESVIQDEDLSLLLQLPNLREDFDQGNILL